MTSETPRLLALGDSAWTVEFGTTIDAALNARVMALADRVEHLRGMDPDFATVTDVVPTFRSLTLHFDPLNTATEALGQRLLALADSASVAVHSGRSWCLPVCFDPAFAPDLPGLAQARHLSERDVIDRLLGAEFRVYMIGFLPGFPYMGGLPAELAVPRLSTPRQRVPANSLAVTGQMCAVYPWESPGGWNLLGRTPLALFDLAHTEQPAMLSAGDKVRWRAIPREEYDRLADLARSGQLARESFLEQETRT